jgi:hypothetical protein
MNTAETYIAAKSRGLSESEAIAEAYAAFDARWGDNPTTFTTRTAPATSERKAAAVQVSDLELARRALITNGASETEANAVLRYSPEITGTLRSAMQKEREALQKEADAKAVSDFEESKEGRTAAALAELASDSERQRLVAGARALVVRQSLEAGVVIDPETLSDTEALVAAGIESAPMTRQQARVAEQDRLYLADPVKAHHELKVRNLEDQWHHLAPYARKSEAEYLGLDFESLTETMKNREAGA